MITKRKYELTPESQFESRRLTCIMDHRATQMRARL